MDQASLGRAKTVRAASGHIRAHLAQLVQASGCTSTTGWCPIAFTVPCVEGQRAGLADVDAQAAALASLVRDQDGPERGRSALQTPKWGIDQRSGHGHSWHLHRRGWRCRWWREGTKPRAGRAGHHGREAPFGGAGSRACRRVRRSCRPLRPQERAGPLARARAQSGPGRRSRPDRDRSRPVVTLGTHAHLRICR